MGIEDRDYMKERARERRDEERRKQFLKSEFNDNKYKGREWSVKTNHDSNDLSEDPWRKIECGTSKFIDFFKHRSGKDVPLSVKEIFLYFCQVIGIIQALDRPQLSMEWRLIPIILMSALAIYVLRQVKIRTYNR